MNREPKEVLPEYAYGYYLKKKGAVKALLASYEEIIGFYEEETGLKVGSYV